MESALYLVSGVWLFFTLFYVIAYLKNDISFIDIGWGPGFLWLFLCCAFIYRDNLSVPQILVGALVFVWSARLALYLYGRNRQKGEDQRYIELAKNWRGPYWLNAYFRVYMVQTILLLIVGLPIIISFHTLKFSIGPIQLIGALIALIGLGIETIADWQMAVFQKIKPRPSKFCRIGLWQHSRHPNYFGEIVFWFGLALSVQNPLAFIGPIFLTILLLKVSGVPMLEEKYKSHPQWPMYYQETRVLLPFPKKGRFL